MKPQLHFTTIFVRFLVTVVALRGAVFLVVVGFFGVLGALLVVVAVRGFVVAFFGGATFFVATEFLDFVFFCIVAVEAMVLFLLRVLIAL